MPLIPEGIIDEIQARMDVAELIGRYVPLKRAGRHFKANCPFHKERTPSFMVNTDKQIFHCFGCGVGGNIFSFLMQHDRLTFPEAVRQLAEQTGISVPDAGPDDRQAHASLAPLMDKACRYFERTLAEPAVGKAARAYLEQRGVSAAARERFRLGLAPDGWGHLLKDAAKSGASTGDLEAAGLIIKGSSGYYDRFRNRLMFPIMDARGRIVSFGGRSLDAAQEPKYLNGPETALYTKGRHLFGLAQAKEAIVQAKTAVIVEGYFDCVVLADAGIANVVSPLGTALTVEQIRLLKRYAEAVVLAFDPDAAGEQATLRGIDLLVESGLQVRIAQLPQGVDPDECLRASGRERFQQMLDNSLSVLELLIQAALKRHPETNSESRVKAAQFVLPTIARVPSAMMRSEYVRLLADRLHLDEGAVSQELAKAKPRQAVANAMTPGQARPMSASHSMARGAERMLTALVLDEPSRWAVTQGRLALDEITDPALRRILSVVCELEASGAAAQPARVVSRLSEEGQGALVTELVEMAQATDAKDAAFEECLQRIRKETKKRDRLHLVEEIKRAEGSGQEQRVRQLTAETQRHNDSLKTSRTVSTGPAEREGSSG